MAPGTTYVSNGCSQGFCNYTINGNGNPLDVLISQRDDPTEAARLRRLGNISRLHRLRELNHPSHQQTTTITYNPSSPGCEDADAFVPLARGNQTSRQSPIFGNKITYCNPSALARSTAEHEIGHVISGWLNSNCPGWYDRYRQAVTEDIAKNPSNSFISDYGGDDYNSRVGESRRLDDWYNSAPNSNSLLRAEDIADSFMAYRAACSGTLGKLQNEHQSEGRGVLAGGCRDMQCLNERYPRRSAFFGCGR
jgi:hypothetical protein